MDMRHFSIQGTKNLRSLASLLLRGEVYVPIWQRPFVWSEEQTCTLLESVLHQRFIPMFLLWSKGGEAKELGGHLPAQSRGNIAVIDGAQRLGAIYRGLLGDPGSDRIYSVGPDGRVGLTPRESPDRIPWRALVDEELWKTLGVWKAGFPHAEIWFELRDIAHVCEMLYYCESESQTIEQVLETFSLINRGGTPMSDQDYARAMASR
jgi:hypothetical protein